MRTHRVHVNSGMAFQRGATTLRSTNWRRSRSPTAVLRPGLTTCSAWFAYAVEEHVRQRENFQQAVASHRVTRNNYGWFLCSQGRPKEGLSSSTQAAACNTALPNAPALDPIAGLVPSAPSEEAAAAEA